MLIKKVEGVKYDELGEIELPDGSVRRCKVLEVNGENALVQLFESAAGINLAHSKVRFLGHGTELAVSGDILGRVFDGMGSPIDLPLFPIKALISTARRSIPRHATIRRNSFRRAYPPLTA